MDNTSVPSACSEDNRGAEKRSATEACPAEASDKSPEPVTLKRRRLKDKTLKECSTFEIISYLNGHAKLRKLYQCSICEHVRIGTPVMDDGVEKTCDMCTGKCKRCKEFYYQDNGPCCEESDGSSDVDGRDSGDEDSD